MKEIFDFIKKHNKDKREERKCNAAELLDGVFEKHTEWHWGKRINGKKLEYWPTKNKWMFEKKIYTGTPDDLYGFIKNREMD